MSIVKRTNKSGDVRYDVRTLAPDGSGRRKTFRNLKAAEAYERAQRVARDRGTWTDPRAGRILFEDYSATWVDTRTVRGRPLAPRTVDSYRWLLDKLILPTFGKWPMAKITPEDVRAWYSSLFDDGHDALPPKAYRVLHAIFATAVDEGIVGATPCRIKGGGQERIEERPVVTPAQVDALANAIDARWKVTVLLAAYGQLRFGELVGLRRRDVDLRTGTVKIRSQMVERLSGAQLRGDPKSEAGKRTVYLPAFVVKELRAHLVAYVPADLDAPLFVGARGGLPLRRNWSRIWSRARTKAGVPSNVHLHDLRHMGATLAAQNGGTTKELMKRLGHSSPRAALIYQHAVEERDQGIAKALDKVGQNASKAKPRAKNVPKGAPVVLGGGIGE